ncbi:uncharacterized protein METZ01_LOCUS414777, partial [marine metagenome]
MRHGRSAFLLLAVVVSSPVASSAQDDPLDYPQWRGANRDGGAAAFVEPSTWPTQLTRRWQVETGLGYATPILVGDQVYTF